MKVEPDSVKLIAGWFQMADGDNSILEELANKSKQSRLAFRSKYSKTSVCTIYIFHVDDFKPEWRKKITFNKDYVTSIPINEFKPASLMFVIKIKNYTPSEEEPHVEAHPVFEVINDPHQSVKVNHVIQLDFTINL